MKILSKKHFKPNLKVFKFPLLNQTREKAFTEKKTVKFRVFPGLCQFIIFFNKI